MSPVQRVLLLLSMAALLRQASPSNPLHFLRDLKNKIFASDTTESTEETPIGLNQADVCAINETANEIKITSTESSNTTDLTNLTISSENEAPEVNQTDSNEYYTQLKLQPVETNNLVDKSRSKRQIHQAEINITLKSLQIFSTEKPLDTTINKVPTITQKPEYSTVRWNQDSNPIKDSQYISKRGENNTSGFQNEFLAEEFVKTADVNITGLNTEIAGNETEKEQIKFGQKSDESKNLALDNEEGINSNVNLTDMLVSQNETKNTDKIEQISINYTNLIDNEEMSTDYENISLGLDKIINGTVDNERENNDEVSTQMLYTLNNIKLNITQLHDILDNSTRIIEDIVQNIAPEINITDQIKSSDNKDATLENEPKKSIAYKKNNFGENITSDITETASDGSHRMTGGVKLNSPISLGKKYGNISVDSSKNSNTNNTGFARYEFSERNINDSSLVRNETNNQSVIDAYTSVTSPTENSTNVKRGKRNINFSILAEAEDEELKFFTTDFPDTIGSLSAELPSNETTLLNGTQAIEVVGPVCTKQYEQCTNDTECCAGYKCLGVEENNSTYHCDLRPTNLTLTTPLSVAANNTS